MEFITILGIVIILFLFLNNQGGNRFLVHPTKAYFVS